MDKEKLIQVRDEMVEVINQLLEFQHHPLLGGLATEEINRLRRWVHLINDGLFSPQEL